MMRRALLTALACLIAAAAACFTVTAAIGATMPDYPDAIGDAGELPEKIMGQYLLRQAAAQPDSLIIYGSSELKTTDIRTHPANFFAGKRCGFQVDLIGRGSCQSIIHALSIAASGDALKGRKVVLITAPQSYVPEGIAPDLFLGNFSEQQALTLFADESLPDSIKQYLASRICALTEAYDEANGTQHQRYTAAGLLSRAYASDSGVGKLLAQPYAAVSRWLLDTKDLVASRRVMADYADAAAQPAPAIDWGTEERAALDEAGRMVTNNEFYMQDGYYNTYIGRRLAQQEGKDASLSYAQSPEYDDLRCLLDICACKGLDVLFVHVPLNGKWCDYTGFSSEKRAEYYENVREIVQTYDVELLDLTAWEYEPYFLCDTMHLGWKGWLEVDRAIVEFMQ